MADGRIVGVKLMKKRYGKDKKIEQYDRKMVDQDKNMEKQDG